MVKKKDQAITSVPLLDPVVRRLPETEKNWAFSDDQMRQLEAAGLVSFSAEQWRDLTSLALNWLSELALRKSARPKEFRDRLNKISKSLRAAQGASRLNGTEQGALRLGTTDASELDRHLLHWIKGSPEGGQHFVSELEALDYQIERMIAVIDRLKQFLPPDLGRARPYADERLIVNLADIYEKAGGKVSAYRLSSGSSGFADTPFRRFAQLFYSMLPTKDKRLPNGFDEALADAIAARSLARGG